MNKHKNKIVLILFVFLGIMGFVSQVQAVPILAEVTPVFTPTTDSTPKYTFSSSEDGDISYGGSCSCSTSEAVAGNNSIHFDELPEGTYNDCTITVTNGESEESEPLLVSEFTIDFTIECGGETPCGCGYIVISDYILTEDLNCEGHGLVVGADGITIDGNNHTITGNSDEDYYKDEYYFGIDNSNSYDTIVIQNFSGITNFDRGISLLNCSNSIIQNNTIALDTPSGDYGIYLENSSSDTITNNVVRLNQYGITLSLLSSSNTITLNNISSNTYGIDLEISSSNNTISDNIISSNMYGLALTRSNTIRGNFISNNENDFYNQLVNDYSSNRFSGNIINRMVNFTEVMRTKNIGDTISFNISAFDPNGNDCDNCTTITTFPSETVIIEDESGNDITGHFVPTRQGIYSLVFTVTDPNANTAKRIMRFLIGEDTDSVTTRYYLSKTLTTHGQPSGTDAKSLLFTAPTSVEDWTCGNWVQNSPDEIPNYPLANLLSVDSYTWYKQGNELLAYIGIQRHTTYNNSVDYDSSIPESVDYIWTDLIRFANLNWVMDYPHSWYWLSLKLTGEIPYWITFPSEEYSDQPSYADFTYQYTTTPAIKSISDENIMVLSATANANDTGILNIVLEDLSTLEISTMDIVLSSPSRIDLSFDEWNTSAPYYKRWTEEASEPNIIATHTISGFAPNSYYIVTKDGALVGLYQSDESGKLIFTSIAGSVFAISDIDSIYRDEGEEEANNCFIATAAYGTPMASEVVLLKQFRNEYLLTNPIGKIFVNSYYKVSPQIADFVRKHPILKSAIRETLAPLIWISEESLKFKSLN